MGLFNFLYKLTNIFSNKRKLKVFIILAFILFILFAWSRGVFASTPEDDEALMLYQLSLQESMLSYLMQLNEVKAQGFDQTAFNQLLQALRNYQVYVVVPTGDPNCNYWVYFYNSSVGANSNQLFTTDATWSVGFNSGTEYPCKVGSFETSRFARIVHQYGNRVTPIISSETTSFLLPSACYCVRSTAINDYLQDMGLYSNIPSTFSTSDTELQAITRAGFNGVNSNIQTQTQTMTNSINQATNSITNSVDNLTNTIQDTSTDDSQVEFAQDNNQDTTSGFFTGLFNSFQTAFTDNSYKYVQFPIPFTGKVITFSSTYVRDNIKNNQSFSVIVSLAEAFWWFALGYFVILDIYKKINAIKSGDLTNIENDNITTDLL